MKLIVSGGMALDSSTPLHVTSRSILKSEILEIYHDKSPELYGTCMGVLLVLGLM